MRQRLIATGVVFAATLLAGWFCSWISGVHPFTSEAGGCAVMSIFIGGAVAALTYGAPIWR
jgi:hypothetical protein